MIVSRVLRSETGKRMLWHLCLANLVLITFLWIMQPKEPPRTKVLVISYGHSGASMVRELIKHHSSSFTLDDPLKHVTQHFLNQLPVEMADSSVRKLSTQSDLRQLYAFLLQQWFECQFDGVDRSSITSDSLLDSSTVPRSLSSCSKPGMTTIQFIHACLQQAQQYCSHSQTRMISSTSADIETANILLDTDPDVKVIYFIRDPRAIYHSLQKLSSDVEGDVRTFMSSQCTRMLADVHAAKVLQKRHPMSFKVIIYEEFAEHFVKQSSSLLSFLDLQFEERTKEHIRDMSMRGTDTACHWCPIRASSSQTARAWRREIPFQTVLAIDSVCKTLYRELGYVPVVQENQLRRLSFPLYKTTFLTSQVLQ